MQRLDTVVVVQGPTFCDFVQQIKDSWGTVPLIFSTWDDNENCYTDDDVVLFNKTPDFSGTSNLNMQVVSSLNGFLKAKELGFKRVVKWRSDFLVKEPQLLLNIFKKDCLNFYAWHKHHLGVTDGYVTDFFMEGETEDLIRLFEIEDINPPYPEFAFTKRMFELGFESKANFVCKDLTKNGPDVFWKKYNYWMSDNVPQQQYRNSI